MDRAVNVEISFIASDLKYSIVVIMKFIGKWSLVVLFLVVDKQFVYPLKNCTFSLLTLVWSQVAVKNELS